MKRWDLRQFGWVMGVGVGVWVCVAVACLCVGSTGTGWPSWGQVGLRRENVLLASLVGAGLGAAGCVYQAILRNPLADPYLLGVSSGAALAGYLWQFVVGMSVVVGAVSEVGLAFAGALVAVGIVFALSTRRGRLEPVTLLLVGVIVSAVCGSVFLLINALHPEVLAGGGGPMAFLVGGIRTNLTLWQEGLAAGVIGVGFVLLVLVSGELNVAVLSEAEAEALGVRIHRLRWMGLVVASLVTAAAVAVSGPIGFVGLVCPHLGRLVVGGDQRRLLPVGTVMGACLLAVADAGARWLSQQGMAGTVLPVGVLTGMMGGPFFLFLLWRQRRGE